MRHGWPTTRDPSLLHGTQGVGHQGLAAHTPRCVREALPSGRVRQGCRVAFGAQRAADVAASDRCRTDLVDRARYRPRVRECGAAADTEIFRPDLPDTRQPAPSSLILMATVGGEFSPRLVGVVPAARYGTRLKSGG